MSADLREDRFKSGVVANNVMELQDQIIGIATRVLQYLDTRQRSLLQIDPLIFGPDQRIYSRKRICPILEYYFRHRYGCVSQDYLYGARQVLPQDSGTEDVMTLDHRLECLDDFGQPLRGSNSKDRGCNIGVACATADKVMKQYSLLE